MYLLAPFILQNFKKILRANPAFWICTIFGSKMAHLSWTKFFRYEPLSLLSSTHWPFSLCKILKNSYSGSRVMRIHHFWAQNGPSAPNKSISLESETQLWNIAFAFLFLGFAYRSFSGPILDRHLRTSAIILTTPNKTKNTYSSSESINNNE